jgi:hypothetical protein
MMWHSSGGEQDGTVFPSLEGHDGEVLPFKYQATIDLVGEHHNVAVTDGVGDGADVFFCQDAAGGIVWRIQNDQLCAIGDEPLEFVDVKTEIHLFTELDRHRFCAEEVDHRLIDWEAGVGKNNLVPFIH